MTSRERIRTVFAGEEPDKIPIDLSSRSASIEWEAYERLKQQMTGGTVCRTDRY